MSWLNMIKQAVDSVENQLDSILDSSIEPPTPAKIPNAVKADDSAQRLSDRLSSIVEPSKTSSSRNKNTSDSQPMTPSDLVNRQSPINSGANTKPNAQITNNDSGINNDKKTSEGNDAWGYDDQLLEIELPQSDEPVKTVAPIGKPEPASNISSSKSEKAVVEENLNSGATGIDQLPQVSVENERETEENEVTGDLSIPKSQPKTMLSEGSTVSSPLVPPKSEPLAKTKIPQPGSSPKEIGSPTDIKDLLEKRESQVLMAKTENSQLHETIVELNAQIDSLKDEIEQLKVSSSTSVEALKKRCSDLQEIVDQKTGGEGQIAQLNRALGEKQASIQGLLQEGEQLAKDILKANNTIKKMMKEKDSLQVKVTELEQHSSALEGTLEMLNSEMKTLKEVEKSQKSQISTLTANNSTTKKRINDLEINFVKSEQEIKELKIQLENKSKLIEEQKVGLANEKEDAIKVAVEEQKKINDSLQIKLNSAVDIASGLQKKVESLTSQLQSSNLEYQTELEHTESQYKTQIKQLESRIALLDAKNYELIHSTQHSKEPLLAQIQQLESQLKFSRQDWQHMESSLLARSMAAEKATGDLTLKLDENRIEIEKLNTRIMELESLNSNLERNVIDLESQLTKAIDTTATHSLQLEIKVLKDLLSETKSKNNSNISKLEAAHTSEISAIKQEYEQRLEKSLRNQIRMESEREPSPVQSNPAQIQSHTNQLRSQLQSLETQAQTLKEAKLKLQDELLACEQRNYKLEESVSELETLKTSFERLQGDYDIVLELLGEKEEQIMELQADIEDMKSVFRADLSSAYK